MSRSDHYLDPNAPQATSIVIAVSTFVLDDRDRLLVIRRTDNGLYALPGGRHELGETMTDAAVRETEEETGLRIEVTGLIGVYSNPDHVVAYSDGEVRQEFSICFRARVAGGQERTSDETSEVLWVDYSELGDIPVHPSIRLRIDHGFERRTDPFYT